MSNIFCTEQNKFSTFLPIVFFILGFLLFQIVFRHNETQNSEGRREKVKISQEIFDKYKEENEEFFFGS